MDILNTLVLFLAGISGAVFSLFIKNGRTPVLKLLLSFSGAFLLGLCFFHLIPEVYEGLGIKAGMFIVTGFFVQIILEYFSKGVEHGHFHLSSHNQSFPAVVMLSLCLHAFMEGMPLGGHDHGHSLLLGIALHKVPVSIVLMTMFLNTGIGKSRALMFLMVFALMSPLGLFTFEFLQNGDLAQAQEWVWITTGLLIGILLHVSTTILFESSEGHQFNLLKFIIVLCGVSLAFIV